MKPILFKDANTDIKIMPGVWSESPMWFAVRSVHTPGLISYWHLITKVNTLKNNNNEHIKMQTTTTIETKI